MLLNGLWVNPRHRSGPRAKLTVLARRGTDIDGFKELDRNISFGVKKTDNELEISILF